MSWNQKQAGMGVVNEDHVVSSSRSLACIPVSQRGRQDEFA